MSFLEYFYYNIVKYDLINKFKYKKIHQIPKFKKIVLHFNFNNINLKQLASGILALELLTTQKSFLIKSKTSNISLKIRKGYPIGCQVILRKTLMYQFYSKLLIQFFLNIKQIKLSTKKKIVKKFNNSFSFEIEKILFFSELGNHYHVFNKLSNLKIVIATNSSSSYELFFLLKSFKFPIYFFDNF